MSTPLQKVAARINELAKQESDTRLRLCRAIASAMDLVKQEGLSWRKWAKENLRQADGEPWALGTLYKMAMFGRNPKKLANERRSVREHGQRARNSLRSIRVVNDQAAAASTVSTPKHTIDVEKEFRWLMDAWKRSSPQARKMFLDHVMKQMEQAS